MASFTEFTLDRPHGKKRAVEAIEIDGRKKRLVNAKGHLQNRCTIVGDSMTQFADELLYTSVQSVPGAYARDFIKLCTKGSISIAHFKVVLIFLGTNDLCDTLPSDIALIFSGIIDHVRANNPDCRIAVAGILPRPCDDDYPTMLKARIDTNVALAALCKRRRVSYIKTEACFKDMGTVDDLYYPGDYIHLSKYGVDILVSHLEGKIGSLLGTPPQWIPTPRSGRSNDD